MQAIKTSLYIYFFCICAGYGLQTCNIQLKESKMPSLVLSPSDHALKDKIVLHFGSLFLFFFIVEIIKRNKFTGF